MINCTEDKARYQDVRIKISFWGHYLPSGSAVLKKGEISSIPGGLRSALTKVSGETGIKWFLPVLGFWIERKL